MPYLKSTSRSLMIWLALLLTGVVSGDLVVDMVFESPEVSDTSESGPISEEPDDSAEHLLMPSQRIAHVADFTLLHSFSHVGTGTCPLQPGPSHVTERPRSCLSEFSSTRGPSFLLALRI